MGGSGAGHTLKLIHNMVLHTIFLATCEGGRMAEAAGAAVMPAYTHMRRAQPVLVAHFFLAHAAALRRDHARFLSLIEVVTFLHQHQRERNPGPPNCDFSLTKSKTERTKLLL